MADFAIDDKLLGAWLDGELDGAERAAERTAVDAWLRDHPDDAVRMRLWAADGEALRARLAPMVEEPVPDALLRAVWRRSDPPRWLMAASAAGLLLVGGVVGAMLGGPAARHAPAVAAAGAWVQRAVYAHSVYVPEPRHAVEVKAQEEHLSRWLTSRINLPVKLFDLRAQGFELVGGRLLPDGAGKSAQLMYENAAKQRVTVYLRKPEDGTEAAFRYEQHGELGLFYWVEAGAGYAVVGDLPRAQLLELCEAIYKQNPALPGAASAPSG